MKITRFIINQTTQVKQYHPLSLSVEFEIETESLTETKAKIASAKKFVTNSLKAEVYKEMIMDNLVDLKDEAKYMNFIDKHNNFNYFEDETFKLTTGPESTETF